MTPPAAAPTAVAASTGGAKRPTASPMPPPSLTPFRPRWSPVCVTWTSPSASYWTRTTPSTVMVSSPASFSTASKSRSARSSNRYAAISTSLLSSLMVVPWSCADPAGGVGLRGVLVEGVFVVAVEVGGDVEDDLADRAGERERRLVGVAAVDDEAVVAADVHAGVAAEPERHGVVHPAAADRLAGDEQGDLARGGGFRRVGGEGELDVHLARRERSFGFLAVLEDAEERVGVLELSVLDVEREAAEMARVGDDHAFGPPVGDVEVGADRVGVVVDPRHHAGGDVLHVAVVGGGGLRAERRQDPEEGREAGEQRLDVVLLGLLPEEGLQLLDLLRVGARQVDGLREVVGQVVELDGVRVGVPDPGGERLEHLRVQAPGDAGHAHGQPPGVLVHRAVAEGLGVLLRVARGGAGVVQRVGEGHTGHRLLVDAVDARRLGDPDDVEDRRTDVGDVRELRAQAVAVCDALRPMDDERVARAAEV